MPDAGDIPFAGGCEPGFERVREAFVGNFTELGEAGAGVCVYHRGRKVVDLCGGWSWKKEGLPYDASALQLIFSSTKGATALCAHILGERGELDFDAPVAEYWPEFAAAGKGAIPVRQLLSHQAGLPTIDTVMKLDDVLAWDPIVGALAAQKPFWEPGTAHGYHALTYGWLAGEVIRRISGKNLGTFFADEVAKPLGLDFWIGLPETEEARVSRLRVGALPSLKDIDPSVLELATEMFAPGSLLLRALTLNGSFGEFMGGNGPFNRREVHAAEMPAANGITNASSLARMYAATVSTVDGVRLLSPEAVDRATRVQSDGKDRVLVTHSRFGTGFMLDSADFSPLLGPSSFGHSGAGGSLGFADPEYEIGFGYVMNQMRMVLGIDQRPARLVAAVRDSLV